MPMSEPEPPCPVCGKTRHWPVRPFCSARCAEVDLGRWLSDVYRVPGGEAEPPDLAEDAP
jgi:endogenous inhibitor of DNA gyrase (YacG/DUF329 family)